MELKIYKIRNQKGEFSTGGQYPSWSKNGKVWRNKGGLSNHLSLVKESFYDNCELIEYVTKENAIIPMEEVFEQKKLNKIRKNIEM